MTGGVFGRVLRFYEQSMRRSLRHPVTLGVLCAVLIVASYACYRALGSDLLPAIDEGGFVLDYVMPPGSSLQETDRVMRRIEAILRATPEVENTSRRTGLELGLAAVTEPNTGDIAVKLKAKRSRGVDEVISDVRAKIVKTEPGLDIEFVQVLQDMFGDLTGARAGGVLFSPDPELLPPGPQVAEALEKVKIRSAAHRRRRKRHRQPYQRSGSFYRQSGGQPRRITPEELGTVGVAMVEGEPALAPVLINDRPYPLRVRFPSARASLEAMTNTILVKVGSTSTLGASRRSTVARPERNRRENLQRLAEVTARLEGVDMGISIAAARDVADLSFCRVSVSRRRHAPGTEIVPRPDDRVGARDRLIFLVLLFEFGSVHTSVTILSSAILSTSGVFFALLVTRTTFSLSSFMGLISGRDRREERHPAARRERKFRSTILAGRGDYPGDAAGAADRDDGHGGRRGHAAGARAGRRIADAQPLAIAVAGSDLDVAR